jgi:hypothetical protein
MREYFLSPEPVRLRLCELQLRCIPKLHGLVVQGSCYLQVEISCAQLPSSSPFSPFLQTEAHPVRPGSHLLLDHVRSLTPEYSLPGSPV